LLASPRKETKLTAVKLPSAHTHHDELPTAVLCNENKRREVAQFINKYVTGLQILNFCAHDPFHRTTAKLIKMEEHMTQEEKGK
jgi:hypothetical protein